MLMQRVKKKSPPGPATLTAPLPTWTTRPESTLGHMAGAFARAPVGVLG